MCKPRGLYFSKALFEGLIFGGAYIGREISVTKSIGKHIRWKEIYVLLHCFLFLIFLIGVQLQVPSISPGRLTFGGTI